MTRGILAILLFTFGQARADERAAAAFVARLQQAVARNDRAAVAEMVRYPLTIFAGGVRIPITDAADLTRSYDAVFSPPLKLVIAQAAMRKDGRIEGEALEIEPVGGRLLITAIRPPASASSPGAAENARGAVRRQAPQPRRISIGFGRVEHLGALGPGQREAFVLTARKNQVLDARITGVSGRDVVLEITNVKTQAPIDAKARDGVRTWIGRIPEDGDYRLDVVRLAPRGGAQLLYTLLVSLR